MRSPEKSSPAQLWDSDDSSGEADWENNFSAGIVWRSDTSDSNT